MKTSHIVLIILSVCALAAILYLLTAGNKATKSSITNDRTLLGSNVSEGYDVQDQEQPLQIQILTLHGIVQSLDAYQIMSKDDFQINIPGYTKEQVLNALKYTTMFMKSLDNGTQTIISKQIQTDYIEHLKNYTDLVTNPLFYILYDKLDKFNYTAENDNGEVTELKAIEIDCGKEELCTEDNISSIKMIVRGDTIGTQNDRPQYNINMNYFKDFEDQNPIIKNDLGYNMCDNRSIKQTCGSGETTVQLDQVTVTLKQFNEYTNSLYSYLKKLLADNL